jgi:hypothetical protein
VTGDEVREVDPEHSCGGLLVPISYEEAIDGLPETLIGELDAVGARALRCDLCDAVVIETAAG